MPTINVLFFARAKELVGMDATPLTVDTANTNAQSLKLLLLHTFPALTQLGDTFVLALS